MKAIETTLPGVLILEPEVFRDARGVFWEVYHRRKFEEIGIGCRFVQDNHSRSRQGTLRGLHYQLVYPQAKLCRVVLGEVLDVAVDIRRGSPTFGKSACVVLSAQNQRLLFIPEGFAHGYLVRTEHAEFLYKCGDFYRPEDEHGLAWDDPQLAIPWELTAPPVLSARDLQNPRLADLPSEDLPAFL